MSNLKQVRLPDGSTVPCIGQGTWYLGEEPLAETVACLRELVAQGKIRRWGVSNFDAADMAELFSIPGGGECAAVQDLYHIGSRGIEFDLLPMLRLSAEELALLNRAFPAPNRATPLDML